MTFRRMLPFIIINILVSAATVLGVLFWWQSQQPEEIVAVATVPADAPVIPALVTATLSPADAAEAEAAVEATAEAEEPEQEIYVVRAGDTLGTIATLYGIDFNDIMVVNGMDNPNILVVGQELIIPIGGLPEPTATAVPTDAPDVIPSPIPTASLEEGVVVIEIAEVLGVGDLPQEAVLIVNSGDRAIALQDWTLVDESGFQYKFGQVTLFGDGAGITIHTEAGQNTISDLYWGLEQAVWSPGERIRLFNAEGTLQVDYTLPTE